MIKKGTPQRQNQSKKRPKATIQIEKRPPDGTIFDTSNNEASRVQIFKELVHKFGIDFNLFDRADAETIRSAGQTSTAKRDKLTLLMQKPTKVMCRGLLGSFHPLCHPFYILINKNDE